MNRRSFLALTAGGAAAASAGLVGQHWLSRAGQVPADRQPGMGGAMLGRAGSVLTVNGQVNPTIETPAGG
jgi:FtsP/CotA-like multicopper oxidase with cupredoxin domain